MKHIVNFSGGDCSFWAAHRVVQRHGPANVVLLWADTLIEDPTLYDFNRRASEVLGVPITRISLEMTPWELFEKEGLIGNDRFPICSVRLKREILNEWMAAHFEMHREQGNALFEPATCYLGFDWTEPHRVAQMRQEHPTWIIEAPMTEAPFWNKCKMREEAEKLGLPEQRLYKLGFPHNNCGGGCVRAGISHFVHLLKVLPAVFDYWERSEIHAAATLKARGIEPLTVLKDRRGGTTNLLYLRDLRLRVESGEEFDRFDWGGCGCGGATKAA